MDMLYMLKAWVSAPTGEFEVLGYATDGEYNVLVKYNAPLTHKQAYLLVSNVNTVSKVIDTPHELIPVGATELNPKYWEVLTSNRIKYGKHPDFM